MTGRLVLAAGVASFVAGCVQPAYVQPGPVQLLGYPPVTYRADPDYRPPIGGPIALQPPPVIQPLPPPAPIPVPVPGTADAPDDLGPIPVQDMPAPASDAPPVPQSTPTPTPTPAAPEIIRKVPASGPGNNVPLEGFRPMKGQTRPTP